MSTETGNSENKYVPVKIETFRNATRDITFDVFIKLTETNFVHVFSRATGLDYKRLAQYLSKGIETVYILAQDKGLYDQYMARTADKIFADPNQPSEKKIAALLNMTEQNMSEIFVQLKVKEVTAKKTKQVVENYVNLMIQNPKSLAMILKLVSHGDYLYYHSIAVSIISMFIAKATGQFNKRMLEIVGLGGFLHDIGCTQLPKEINESAQELNPEQWDLMRNHPAMGLEMLDGIHGIHDEVRYIVFQHHEQPAGRGYPNAIKDAVIYYPAKIVAIADSFSALISQRPFRKAYSIPEAISIIESETGKFDRHLVQIMKQVFLRSTETPQSQGEAA